MQGHRKQFCHRSAAIESDCRFETSASFILLCEVLLDTLDVSVHLR
jgi:hypothetical protein